MQGTTTPGELAAFFLYALIIAGPIGTFVRIYTQIQEALGKLAEGSDRQLHQGIRMPAQEPVGCP